VDAPGGQITGFEVGDGSPVILFAGVGATSRIWGNMPTMMSRRFRVIAVDNRGVGGSRAGQPFSFSGAVRDVEAVLDARNIDRAAVFGASMGGLLALMTALRIPGRISRVAVASAAARLSVHGRRLLELFQDLLLYAPPERAGAALMTLAFAPPFHEKFAGFVDETIDLYGIDEADLPGTMLQVDELLRGWDIRHELHTLEVPALVLCGDRDPVVAPEDTVELAESLPQADLVRVPCGAHSVLAEGGEAILDRVTDFLSG
jgi:pimeloyl-ACP methyl ester carboxylesterase